jgi:hypothetical protein
MTKDKWHSRMRVVKAFIALYILLFIRLLTWPNE